MDDEERVDWRHHQSDHHSEQHVYRSPHLRPGGTRELIVEHLRTQIARKIRETGSCRALDVGAGHGSFTAEMISAGAMVTCVEMSAASANTLAKKFSGNDRVTVIHDPDGTAVFGLQPFNLVAAISLLHHIPDYLGWIARMGDLVEPDGIFVAFQDPTYYPRRGRPTAVVDAFTHSVWRLGQGGLRRGVVARIRRTRGKYDESDPADMVEYHVVRQGVDELAVAEVLRHSFGRVNLIEYWSAHLAVADRLIQRTSFTNTFGVVATDRYQSEI